MIYKIFEKLRAHSAKEPVVYSSKTISSEGFATGVSIASQ